MPVFWQLLKEKMVQRLPKDWGDLAFFRTVCFGNQQSPPCQREPFLGDYTDNPIFLGAFWGLLYGNLSYTGSPSHIPKANPRPTGPATQQVGDRRPTA